MNTRRIWVCVGLAGMLVLAVAPFSRGVITALTPLKVFVGDSQFIVVTKVEKLQAEKLGVLLTVTDDLKGKAPFRKLPITLKGTKDTEKDVPELLKRLGPDLPVILFVSQRGKVFTTFAFSNGTWFQVIGRKTGEDTVSWGFTHLEPYLRRTFKGTTAELRRVIEDSVAGKKAPPEPNDKEEPGLGPVVPEKKDAKTKAAEECRTPKMAPNGTLFAVIPTLGVGGPLAILAILFPSVFGGVLVLFRRWLAFFTVISVVSLVYLVHFLCRDWLRGSWWGGEDALWLVMMGITFLGTLWAWGRYTALCADPARPSPGRAEQAVLWILSGCCLGTLAGYALFDELPSFRSPEWGLLLVFAVGIWLATLYKAYRGLLGERRTAPLLSIEGLMLWGTLIGFTALAVERGGGRETRGQAIAGESVPGDGVMHPAELVGADPIWTFTAPYNGAFVSSGVLHGDHLFIAARDSFRRGTLYCFEKRGGKIAEFIAGGDFKQPYSSPCIADGRLYIGEGFHGEQNCSLYSVDLSKLSNPVQDKRLAEFWSFPTPAEIESSPAVANGKVYFGGGNDRFYAIDQGGKRKVHWSFPPEGYKGRLLRFGSGPAVAGKRVFTGTGVDRYAKDDAGETALFCLDADKGEQIWKVAVDLPAWATPTVIGPHTYFALGNGDILYDADHPEQKHHRTKPAGAVVCLETETGKQVWRKDFKNGVLAEPAVDRHHVYVGCRDELDGKGQRQGHVYALDRFSGQQRWKTPMGSAVVAAPALAKCSHCEATTAVYAVATKGRICCLDPATGKVQWTWTLEPQEAHLVSAPRVEVIRTAEGDHRRIYFGAAVGPGSYPYLSGLPVVYCLEDRVKER